MCSLLLNIFTAHFITQIRSTLVLAYLSILNANTSAYPFVAPFSRTVAPYHFETYANCFTDRRNRTFSTSEERKIQGRAFARNTHPIRYDDWLMDSVTCSQYGNRMPTPTGIRPPERCALSFARNIREARAVRYRQGWRGRDEPYFHGRHCRSHYAALLSN